MPRKRPFSYVFLIMQIFDVYFSTSRIENHYSLVIILVKYPSFKRISHDSPTTTIKIKLAEIKYTSTRCF